MFQQLQQKHVAFMLGLLIGCVVVGYIFSSKAKAQREIQANDPVKVFRPVNPLPGQVPRAKVPLYAPAAKFTLDEDPDERGIFKRILIEQKNEGAPLYRFEEMIWLNPETKKLHLVSRQKMYADQVIVRLTGNANKEEILEEISNSLNCKILKKRSSHLFILQLPGHNPNSVPNAIEKLLAYSPKIEGALPHYIFELE